MNKILNKINTEIYDKCGLKISDFRAESESKEYDACQFELNGLKIVCRTAKITPKKVGQFVAFWKRNGKGITEPFSENDGFDFYVVNVSKENAFGQFIFPKAILVANGIVTTDKKDGKRGFRVYPIWDIVGNKQAKRTQRWQCNYFFIMQETTDLKRVKELYKQKSE